MINKAAANKDDFTTKEAILYSAGGLVMLGGSFYFIRHLVQKGLEQSEHKKSYADGSPATYAKGIKMAFENDGWPGTNIVELRRILREISSKEGFENTAKSYKKLYNENILKDMSNELQSSEYAEMINILASKPEKQTSSNKPVPLSEVYFKAWAKRLKAAFDKTYGFMPGTDEEAIRAVFMEIPTQAAFVEVGKAYQREYGINFITDLKSELEIWEYEDFMEIITSKPQN